MCCVVFAAAAPSMSGGIVHPRTSASVEAKEMVEVENDDTVLEERVLEERIPLPPSVGINKVPTGVVTTINSNVGPY